MQFKALVLAATILAALAAPVSAQIKDHVFKVGIGLNEDHPPALAVKYFAEQLAAKSGGKREKESYQSFLEVDK